MTEVKITKTDEKPQKIPPDGGWGWYIVVAQALSNVIIIPVMQTFGLLFQDKFKTLNMSATDISVIINLNSAFGMGLGLLNGPLLRYYSFRKVAIAAGVFFSIGMFCTAFANSFGTFAFSYGIIASAGFGLSASSFSLALNTYFKKLRNKAAGVSMTLTGLGPIFFPHIVSFLLGKYGVQGATLIISAFALHVIAAALLLQPVKWHMKDAPEEMDNELEELKPNEQSEIQMEAPVTPAIRKNNESMWTLQSEEENSYLDHPRKLSSAHDFDTQSIYGFDVMPGQLRKDRIYESVEIPTMPSQLIPPKIVYNRSISSAQLRNRSLPPITPSISTSNLRPTRNLPPKRWFEGASSETINLGSSLKIFDEDSKRTYFPAGVERICQEEKRIMQNGSADNLPAQKPVKPIIEEEVHDESFKGTVKRIARNSGKKVVKFFDLDLLRDPIYVNLMLGMSIAIFAELNFSMLTPFILGDLNYSTEQIASIMSTLGVADIIFRFISPFIGDYFEKTPRTMYIWSLIMLILTRTSMMFANSFGTMLIVGLGLGAAKGVRTVYMSLVIPSYVPLERLASASGIQMVTNGIILMCLGPIIGVIRDFTGSYMKCIIFINAVTCITLLMWFAEMCYNKNKEKSKLGDQVIN